MSDPESRPARNPWAFVPALYFLQGVPNVLVQIVTTTFLARIGMPVDVIGHWSSLVKLPWTVKPAWGPLVDLVARKRTWIVSMQALILLATLGLCLAVTRADALTWTVAACALIAVLSATHDIAADGFYLLALDKTAQAAFVGVRSAFFRLAMVFASGAVVYIAGSCEKVWGDVPRAWSLAIAIAAGVYGLGAVWNALALPRPAADAPVRPDAPAHANARARAEASARTPPFLEALGSYFRQPRIAAVLAFILSYRFGESMLTTMSSPFLLATKAQGGLSMSTDNVGLALGTVGVVALIVGGLLGGLMISKRGLARCLWPMVIAMHAPNLLYLWAAAAQPGFAAISAVIAVEQLGYGFGFSAYMVYLMYVSRESRYPTTHYAISTGFMGLAAQLAGFVSGDLVESLGYAGFFAVVCAASIPGMLTLLLIPLDRPGSRPEGVG